ncbi:MULTISPECIES: hypothetical protein [unclassified Crossiella]|uniref:hypothetical protein n=1 Tax=unclassified Crossiella TaxID=2620835 RepID=UPI001FFF456A|nr:MULTISPECIES: hypothetical protein [unclassified Crossiella]MCK2239772.1 hypothetical protein [Crossiella sp. S99.2]MCK2252467.1 hypothetical protein [Crossiella sp. S99.1]
MFAALLVDGTPAEPCEDTPGAVTLEFATDTAATHRCRACGEELHKTVSGYETDLGETGCPDFEPHTDTGPESGEGPHDPEHIPVSWCNSAAVHTDESQDSVTVSISVGDPRGAFTLTIRRMPDDVDCGLAGHLIMHTPYAGQPLPHMELTPLHDGTYVVGPYTPTQRTHSVPPAA